MTWQLQEAKNKFSEVVNATSSKGPQIISRNGRMTAVLLSYEDYQRLTAKKTQLKKSLISSGFDQLDTIRDKSVSGRSSDFNL